MSEQPIVDLYGLLPALYRLRDAEQRYPLSALLEVIAEQADIVKRDMDDLWDNYFIETCDDWVVSYIGDLVANIPLHDLAERRVDVARTIYYRRRKGTLPMLEELARNVTGWGAHAVTFFESLGWTQNLNHLRYQQAHDSTGRDPDAVYRVGTLNVRDTDTLDSLDGPFDTIAHSVDVRNIGHARGWHNVRNVGFFLWRLRRYPLAGVAPRPVDPPFDYRYHFSPLGNPAPLFTNPRPREEASEGGLVDELRLPGPIRPASFDSAPEDYYGPDRSLQVFKDGLDAVPRVDGRPQVVYRDLHDWAPPPEPGQVAVDVRRGRLTFRNDEKPTKRVEVYYNYGFSADLGGGPYDRRRPLPRAGERAFDAPDTVANPYVLGELIRVPADCPTIEEALEKWYREGRPAAVIQIEDSDTYALSKPEVPATKNLIIYMVGTQLVIQAAPRQRPTLIGDVIVEGGGDQARLTLNGLLIEGSIEVRGSLSELSIEHCTLVPGRSLDEDGLPREPDQPSVTVRAASQRLRLNIDRSIVGPLHLPSQMVGLEVRDSIIDSPRRGARAKITPALVGEQTAIVASIGPDLPMDMIVTLSDDQAPGSLPPGAAIEPDLDRDSSREVYALVSGPLPQSIPLSSEESAVCVTIGTEGPFKAVLPKEPSEQSILPDRARELLQEAIRAAHHSTSFKDAFVSRVEDRLVVLPGGEGKAVSFGLTPDDQDALTQNALLTHLALEKEHPAVAASQGGELAGPSATLERSTVFGTVHVRELSLASEVIFTAPVTAERRQAGCVRFSYVPESSRTPGRYRCQPDRALAQRAREASLTSEEKLAPAEKALIQSRLRPSFTSTHYGDPAYAQLDLTAAEELLTVYTGAEDGSEMGALCHLRQPQRAANLRVRLEEYLPFGMEYGLIHVT